VGDAYVRDVAGATTRRVSVADDGSQIATASFPGPNGLTPDGRYVVFSTDLPTPGGERTTSRRDLVAGTTLRVDRMGNEVFPENEHGAAGISDDGRFVLMVGSTPAGPTTNNVENVYLRDLASGERLLVSRSFAAVPLTKVWGESLLSGDGRYAVIRTEDPKAVPGDTNNGLDTYLRATTSPRIDAVSVVGGGPVLPGSAGSLAITGAHLFGGVVPTLGDGVTVDAVSVTDEQHARVDFHVAPDAAAGPRLLHFLAGGSGPAGISGTAVYPGAIVVGT
jgi:hypothetical protein